MADRPFQHSPWRTRLWNLGTKVQAGVYTLTGGRLMGSLDGAPLLVLHTVGRRSGKRHATPLIYVEDGPTVAVVASKGGAAEDPFWWDNLQANPDTMVRVGREKRRVRARKASPEERARLWRRFVETWPENEEYAKRTEREMPVVLLEPRGIRE
jgi:deazaflavin-dependent oxidoreductase (nitroreductase family)